MKTALYILALLGAAAANAAVSFGPVKNYPNIGFMFPCLSNAKADPIPLPLAHAYVSSEEDSLVREDRFDPFELWYANQCCARWHDAEGNRLVVGRLTCKLPDFEAENVSRKRFDMEMSNDDNLVNPDKAADVNEWVATFVDTVVYEPKKVKLNSFALDELRVFPCDATNTLIYAFRPRRIGNAKNFDWFCVMLQVSGATDIKVLRAAFEEQFIGKIALPNRSSAGEGAQSGEVSTTHADDKPFDQPNHPVRIEARKSVENYDTWWFAETDGYIILSDVSTEVGKSIVRDVQDALPAFRKAYEKLVPPLTRERDVSLIRLFQTRDDYVRYVGKDQAWTGGVWMPGRRELVLAQGFNKEEMMRVIRHEAFHQYLSYAYCMIPAAPWMNEGHACLFENASADKKGKVTLNEDPARCPMLVENIEVAVALLPRLLEADYPAFYAGSESERGLKYAVAWGLAYYLQKGAPTERNTSFKTIMSDYAASLAQTHTYGEATKQAFAKINMAVFQENFREFWLKRRASAMQYDPLAD